MPSSSPAETNFIIALLPEGETLSQLAARLDIPRLYLQKLGAGNIREPGLGRSRLIADALGLTLEEFDDRLKESVRMRRERIINGSSD